MCDIENRKHYQVATTLIKANSSTVWSILTDYEQLKSRFTHINSSKFIRSSEYGKVFVQEAQPMAPYPAVRYTVEVQETYPTFLAWRGLSSYIKINQGYFWLQPREHQSTFVVYAKCIEGALLVPGQVIRYQLELIMPKVLIELKTHAEFASSKLNQVSMS